MAINYVGHAQTNFEPSIFERLRRLEHFERSAAVERFERLEPPVAAVIRLDNVVMNRNNVATQERL